MKHLRHLKKIKNLWENQKSTKIKILMSDNGGKYIGNEIENYLKTNGTEHRLSVSYCP